MDLRDAQIRFFQKFAHLYDSGVPLAEALDTARVEASEPLRGAVKAIVDELYAGSSLADAMDRRSDAFSPEVVTVIRAGEQRGELGQAARNAAVGLRERFLEPRRVAEAELDGILEFAGDARFLHLEPQGRLKIRTAAGLSDGGPVDTAALGVAMARRAGIAGDAGIGAFLWRNRLVRVAVTATPDGPSTVARLSDEPGPEPPEAAAWREGRAGLLVAVGGRYADLDACLRSCLAAFGDGRHKCLAIDLPVPEALAAHSLEAALAQDPDVVCLSFLRDIEDVRRIAGAVDQGVHALVGAATERPFANLAHRVLRLA